MAFKDSRMDFTPSLHPPDERNRPALWFIFEKGRLLVNLDNGCCAIPDGGVIAEGGIAPARSLFLGTLGDQDCYAAELKPGDPVPAPFSWVNLRSLFNTLDEDFFWIAGRANHLLDWDQSHRFCGRCGHPTQERTDERAKGCPRCGLINYPRLSPAIIVAVINNGRILLARNKRFRGPFYSVLAGFVEPGESLEQCVRREVCEEVGLTVTNIRYFGSQPWPFPNSLMVGFIADYAGGEIVVDDTELMEADWFSAHTLPEVPPKVSIARQLIDWFTRTHDE
jgi:NAD+ diphosphatase